MDDGREILPMPGTIDTNKNRWMDARRACPVAMTFNSSKETRRESRQGGSRFRRTWKALAAGLCGSAAHSGLMFLKSQMDWLPSFHPYEDLQQTLNHLIGGPVHPLVPWALSFFNGAVVLGFLFGHTYCFLPGRSGAAKGTVFGVFGWIVMSVIFFPMFGQGLFATQVGLGVRPALFSLLMLLTYSIIMGIAYSALSERRAGP